MDEDAHLKKIIDGPVYLLEGNDGMIHGNSQALAKELLALRIKIRKADRKEALESLISGHIEAMRPLLNEWSEIK